MLELFEVWKGSKKANAKDDWILAGASVVIPAGRKIGLLGDPKKTSAVLKLLSGIEDPDKGVIRRVGVPCWPFDYSGFSDNGATLRQNANFMGRVYGVDANEITRIAILLSGVRAVRGRTFKNYSMLERKALELGLTLSIQFDWYFVDEKLPKAPDEVDEAVHAAIADRISRASLIWASSAPKMLSKFCDAGLILDQGLLTFYDDFEQALAAYDVLTTPEAEVLDQDDGQLGGKKRRRRAARRARQNGAEEPV